jgi:predicted nucleotidyltransferase
VVRNPESGIPNPTRSIIGMLAERDRLVVERFKRRLVERGVPLHSMVLFGSRARGEGEWDSDYDVLVVVECLDRTTRETISKCAWEAGFDDCLVIVPVVVTRDEIENSPFRSSLLIQAVRAEGIPI